MDAATIALIGVFGTGLISAFFVFYRLLSNNIGMLGDKLERLGDKIDNLTGEVHTLDIKFTGEIHALETKLTNKLTGEIHALETKLTNKLRTHGERLARIEAKLNIDPPAEAA